MKLTNDKIKNLKLGAYQSGDIDFIIDNEHSVVIDFNANTKFIPFETSTGHGGWDTIHSVTIVSLTLFKDGDETSTKVEYDEQDLEYFLQNWLVDNHYVEDYIKN